MMATKDEKKTKVPVQKGKGIKYKPGMCGTAKKIMADGGSKKSVAAMLGISSTCFYNYVHKYPAFKQAVDEGEALSYKFWEDLGKQMAVDGSASVWGLVMANRFGWRSKNEVTGEDGGPLRIEIVEVGE